MTLLPNSGSADGLIGVDAAQTQIALISDGSPDIFAIRAFNTLEGLDVPSPVFWENIGSKITFQVTSPYTGGRHVQAPHFRCAPE